MPSNTSFFTPSFLAVNDETFTNYTAIANQLNNHFVDIGKSLITNLSGSNDNDHITYLKSPCPSIYFYPTTPSEIMNMICKFEINKASGNDDTMPFFIKISANINAHPLIAVLNQCIIEFGYFSNKLKFAKVIPKQDQLTNLKIIDSFLFYLLYQKFLNA